MEDQKDIKSPAIVVVEDFGPIKITGNFRVKDLRRDREESPTEIWLCRCGKSNNKPYCDESHKK